MLPERKHPRLKKYDYRSPGYYFVTINTKDNLPVLAKQGYSPEYESYEEFLSVIGKKAKQQIFELESRYPNIKIEKYVIMPTHIHLIIAIGVMDVADNSAGASPRPTPVMPSLFDVVGTYKSLITRICNKIQNMPGRKIFQTSYYEEIIRTDAAYKAICKYIDNNPYNWSESHYYK